MTFRALIYHFWQVKFSRRKGRFLIYKCLQMQSVCRPVLAARTRKTGRPGMGFAWDIWRCWRARRGEWMMDELRWIPMNIGKRPREELGFGGGLAPP
jgi:hypothetical protein